jgi:hypothetical protein
MASEAFKRKCLIYTAFNIMDMYEKRMKILENEAQVRTNKLFYLYHLYIHVSCASCACNMCTCAVGSRSDMYLFCVFTCSSATRV